VKRREFITLLCGASAAWPLVARAQRSAEAKRIGILMHGVQTDPLWEQRLAAFRQELRRFGWLEDHNVQIEVRYSGGQYDRLPLLSHEIVGLNPVTRCRRDYPMRPKPGGTSIPTRPRINEPLPRDSIPRSELMENSFNPTIGNEPHHRDQDIHGNR
jgi:hypothetical protein